MKIEFKIDYKNPIILSGIGIVIMFIVSLLVLWLTKPPYIMGITKSGVRSIDCCMLVMYSALFSVVSGVIIYMCATMKLSPKPAGKISKMSFNPGFANYSYSPRYSEE